jgi:type I pantothenate kinase
VRRGPADFPAHSPTIYDIDPALTRTLAAPDVLILEGLALPRPSLDALIYLDAEEAHLARWFAERFMGLWDAAQGDPTSFYARFPTREAAREVATMVWERVNLPNLRDHIAAARDLADLVVTKGPDHEIVGLTTRGRP